MNFRDLLTVLFDREDERVGTDFPEMLELAVSMYRDVNNMIWTKEIDEALRADVYQRDVRINQIERSIRKEVLTHLALGDTSHVPFCFVLVNVVKDAERIGDYVKNMLDPVVNVAAAPEGPAKAAIRQMGQDIGQLLERVGPVFGEDDEREAETLIRRGRKLASECDDLVTQVAAADLSGACTTALALQARFYKRICAHATNILSAVVMPPHKIDYFDEDSLPGG